MSLINDALRQARKDPAQGAPLPPPPAHRPAPAKDGPSAAAWLFPAVVVLLVTAAIFFAGWGVAHHSVTAVTAAPGPVVAAPPPAEAMLPLVVPPPTPPPAAESAPELPRLQGIFYSATAPSAIIDGRTVRVGDQFGEYRVKEITRYTVTLAGADGKPVQLGMRN